MSLVLPMDGSSDLASIGVGDVNLEYSILNANHMANGAITNIGF